MHLPHFHGWSFFCCVLSISRIFKGPPSLQPGSLHPQAKTGTSSAAGRLCLLESRPRTCTRLIPSPSPSAWLPGYGPGFAKWQCAAVDPICETLTFIMSTYGEPEVLSVSHTSTFATVRISPCTSANHQPSMAMHRPCHRTRRSGKLASQNSRIACSFAT